MSCPNCLVLFRHNVFTKNLFVIEKTQLHLQFPLNNEELSV